MKPASYNPRRLDVRAFAKAGAHLQGRTSVREMPRLFEDLQAPDPMPALQPGVDAPAQPQPEGELKGPWVDWQLEGHFRSLVGGEAKIHLRLQAQTEVPLLCQRCLAPVSCTVELDRTLRFVASEADAARLDEQVEEDVLSMERPLDVRALLEDELILHLPLVPRHAECSLPAPG